MYVCNYRGEACPAVWSKFGRGQVFRVQMTPDIDIVEHLGQVKLKNDGRWVWWVGYPGWCFPRPNTPAPVQGVATTEELARQKVEEYWSTRQEASCVISSSASGPA